MSENGAKILHCRQQWREGPISLLLIHTTTFTFSNIQVQAIIEICIETQHSELKKSVLQRQVSNKTYPDVLVEGGGS